MDRVTEAKLAFIGTGEVNQRPLKVAHFADDAAVSGLIADGFVEIDGDELVCTIEGWRHLHSRPIDT